MTSRRINFAGVEIIALLLSFFALLFACEAMASPYQKCNVPPTMGIGSKPNLLVVMDYSGSMQFPAYFDGDTPFNANGYYSNNIANCLADNIYMTYDRTYSYYGTFESDKYYVYVPTPSGSTTTLDYFRLVTPQPVTTYSITASARGTDDDHIVFTAAGHTFVAGDLVALYDLTSHVTLSTKAVTVTAVGGDTFTVAGTTLTAVKWNGKADTGGSAVKRITGSLIPTTPGDDSTAPGVSGNVLNLAVTSRTDAALKALIGGRSICPECTYDANGALLDGNHDYFLRPQGARTRVQDTSYLFADFYVRPATIVNTPAYPNNAIYPDDYNSGGTYYKDSAGNDRDIFVTIKGQYAGTLNTTHPVYYGKYFEEWTFTLTKRTRVKMTMDGVTSWPGNSYLSIYTVPLAHNGDNNSNQIVSSTSNPASISTDLDPGTYYVRATYGDPTQFVANMSYTLSSNVNLTQQVVSGFAHNGQVLTKIGALPWGRARLKLEPNEKGEKDSRNGVIQRSWGSVRYGFMYYKGDVKDNQGKIVFGLGETNEAKLIGALEGVDRWTTDGLDYTKIYPYYSTPTGEAMWEAYDYYKQQNNMDNADNNNFIQLGKNLDPFYDGDDKPNPCRKNFVLLLSDGVWNGGVDPVKGAHQLWVNDLRTGGVFDPGKQSVETYSILAFSQDPQGTNSMKAVAMYGGFKDIVGCANAGYPYPKSGYPGGSLGSKDMVWPVPECNPAGTYNDTCCREWDTIWDADGDGLFEAKGLPDNYFEASDGKKLEDALLKVIGAITSPLSAASAVATVSQETRAEDVIVRGVFEAIDQSDNDKFLWLGHLEAYLPFTYNDQTVYDFQDDIVPNDFSNPKTVRGLCSRLMGSGPLARHCWDSGEILKMQSPVSHSGRKIFTARFTGRDASNRPIWEHQSLETLNANLLPADFGVTTTFEKDNIINWVRGDDISGSRERKGWILGDIVFSTPVVVGPPKLGNVSKRDPDVNKFLDYLDDESTRPKVVYVGANDGMIHAFLMSTWDDITQKWRLRPSGGAEPSDNDPNIGKELWAYIPSNLLTELKALKETTYGITAGTGSCSHRTMVDLAARHWEVYIKSDHCGTRPDGSPRADAQGRCWRSVIVGGERGGGDVYFAIDITDAYNPILLWEYSVLQNRVVVESDTTACVQSCRNACASAYTTCYNQCCATTYPTTGCNTGTRKTYCKNQCTPAKTTCENNCATNCANAGYKAYVPFRSAYDSLKVLPMSWSQPYLGRIHIPETVKFYYGDPDATGAPNSSQLLEFNSSNNNREVVFMGGGIHLYDKSFDTTPAIEERFKLALFWPNLLMLDIETGYNLFEYVWPVVLNRNSTTFPVKTANSTLNTIPYAMSDVLGLDVWDQVNNVLGDDGYVDRVYVGDMNGYFYGLKFNLAEHFPTPTTTNTMFGVEVNIWPTKPIASADVDEDDYRSELQPITIAPAASFETIPPRAAASAQPALRLIFGTGKYDDVSYGNDDKHDVAKMALYNLRDPVVTTVGGVNYGLPVISSSSSSQVYDSSHNTNFRVQFAPKCGLPNSITSFNTNCDWELSSTDTNTASPLYGLYQGDCCESGNSTCSNPPCYKCIYDFRNPCETGSDGCLTPIDATDAPALGKPGERMLGKPLIAAGMVFLTTFVPPFDPCGFTGEGYLYMFDYMCQPFPPDYVPFPTGNYVVIPAASGGGAPGGYVVKLGAGVPSRPVMDSRGENIIVQMSDGTVKRIKTDLGANKPVQFKGWRER
jgi:type IV pilus assembly protein PilY1